MGETQLPQKTIDEITIENMQTTSESSLESSLEEQTMTMDETTEKNEQTALENTWEWMLNLPSERRKSFLRELLLPTNWITTKDEIDPNSTDTVDKVLLRILEKEKKYDGTDFLLGPSNVRLHVNDISTGNHEPIVVKIGPNKWDTTKSNVTAIHKQLYARGFFNRTDTNLEQLLRANFDDFSFLIRMSKIFNNWSDVPDDELIEKFIIDGCFIIELFLMDDHSTAEHRGALFRSELFLVALSRDLLLLDNQVPFKVLQMLFNKSGLLDKLRQHDGNHPDLIELAFKFLERILPTKKLDKALVRNAPADLRSIVYEGLCWLRLEADNNSNSNNDQDEKDGDDKWNFVKSATELLEFGVEFKVIKTDKFTDIKFTDKGVLEIPCIPIRYGTAYSINMLLQVENNFLYNDVDQRTWLSDYVWFMNGLLKSPSDVQLLRQKKIIDNLSELRDDAAILKFLRDSYESLTISPHNFSYREICKSLNSHCNHRRNSWVAKLKRDYFNSPWAFISFFAASLLIILTIVQTIFSVASYYKGG